MDVLAAMYDLDEPAGKRIRVGLCWGRRRLSG